MTERCPTCKRAMPRPLKEVRSKARRGPMRDPKYRRWCSTQQCVIVLEFTVPELEKYIGLPIDPAHTQNNGMRSKGPDSSCVPLCRKHHQEYDAGRVAFEKKYGVDMKREAAEHYARYLRDCGADSTTTAPGRAV